MKLKDGTIDDASQEEKEIIEKLGAKTLSAYLELEDQERANATKWLKQNLDNFSWSKIAEALYWFRYGAIDFKQVSDLRKAPYNKMMPATKASCKGLTIYWKRANKSSSSKLRMG